MGIKVHDSHIKDCCFLCQHYRIARYFEELPEGVEPDSPFCAYNKVSLRDYDLLKTDCEHFKAIPTSLTESEVLEMGWRRDD